MSEATRNRAVARANAKVNLFLRVLGAREDGYHDLESLVVPIDLSDRLEIHAALDPAEFRTLSLSLEVRGEGSFLRSVPVDQSNLVLRAAAALAERVDARGFAEIDLEKRIPPAAGLGGGSADAAATLKILNELWGCGLTNEALRVLGISIGSDVPAMLAGRPVVVGGRGERLASGRMGGLNLALATFDFGVSTRDAFGWWQEDGAATGPDPAELLHEADRRTMGDRHGDLKPFADLLYNDLEGPVARRHPQVEQAKAAMIAAGAAGAVMSGSGPSVAAVLPWDMTSLAGEAWGEVERVTGNPVRAVGSEASPTVDR